MNIKGRRIVSALLCALLILSGAVSLSGKPLGMLGDCAACSTGGAIDAAVRITDTPSDEGVVLGSRIWDLLTRDASAQENDGRTRLIVGGGVFGTRIKESHVAVSSADEGSALKAGDRIISINGKDVGSVAEIREILSGCNGASLSIVCKRGSRSITLKCTPKQVGDEYKLGAVLREGSAGIGTVTYIDPETGEFGGLGHGICDAESGKTIDTSGGIVTDVILGGVVKGESGKPGELSGILTDRPMGEIYSNNECGVFGKLTSMPRGSSATVLPIAYRSEVKAGAATILSTLKNGTTMEYKVELSEIRSGSLGTKCFRVKVTDPTLLAISGGIVRGMSGSPIIQNGKLVGAVTHVLVDDPTSGYGIFIENMLNASQEARNELPSAA